MLRVHRLGTTRDFDRLRDEWNALAETVLPRTPFDLPVWHELWWRHFRRRSLFANNEFLVCALRNDAGGLVAVAPMMRVSRPSRWLPVIREIQFFGADPNMTEIRGVVCRPEDQDDVLQALSQYLKANVGYTWVRWQGIRRERLRAAEPFGAGARFRWTRDLPAFLLQMPQSWEAFEQAQSRRVRKKLRTCYKYLERDNVSFQLRTVESQAELPAALDRFLELHNARSHVRYFDVFSADRARSFLHELFVEMAGRGQSKVFQLTSDGAVVATRLGFLLGKQLYLYHSGNDPAWDKYSIMTTLLAEIVKWAIANEVAVVNLSTGEDRSKTRWQPTEVTYSDGVEVAPGLLGPQLSYSYDYLRAQMHPGSAGRAALDRLKERLGFRPVAAAEPVSAESDAD